jgi:O-methyltransferase
VDGAGDGADGTKETMKYGAIPTDVFERLALLAGTVPVPVIDALFPIMKARAIMAGVRLGVFEALRDGPRRPEDVAAELRLDADCLDLLMRTLVLADYLDVAGERFALSRLARDTMIAGGRMELFGYLEWNYTQWDLVAQLEAVVRTGRGVDFHETLTDHHAWGHYQRGMLEIARLDAPIVASRVPVRKGATRLLDLAGSHGLIGAAICRRHPPMRSTVIDLPQAVAHARPLATHEGIGDIVEHRTGDIMVDDLGAGADVVVLSNILHHFRPEGIASLLARVRGALASGGTVAIWELEAPQRHSRVTAGDGVALFFRLTSSARAYHGREYAEWLRAAGFESARIVRPMTRPGNVLVTARAPADS